MLKILDYYDTLLDVYTQEVKAFEKLKENFNKENDKLDIRWSPHSVINTRMFHFDVWLTNSHHNYFCYDQKHKILPELIKFLASYNKLNDEDKSKFEKTRLKNKYQEYLDELWKPHIDFLQFLKKLKEECQDKKFIYTYPKKPSRSYAHKQKEEFDKKLKEYWENIENQDKCINEIKKWQEIYESVVE